jgi:hypothetical protein
MAHNKCSVDNLMKIAKPVSCPGRKTPDTSFRIGLVVSLDLYGSPPIH